MAINCLKVSIYGHNSLINTLERKLEAGLQYSDPTVQEQELKEKTALIEHCITYEHRFDTQALSIVDTTFKASALPILEMCQIATTPHTDNRRTDTHDLNTA